MILGPRLHVPVMLFTCWCSELSPLLLIDSKPAQESQKKPVDHQSRLQDFKQPWKEQETGCQFECRCSDE